MPTLKEFFLSEKKSNSEKNFELQQPLKADKALTFAAVCEKMLLLRKNETEINFHSLKGWWRCPRCEKFYEQNACMK